MNALDELMSNINWMIHDLLDADEIDNDEEERLQGIYENSKTELTSLRARVEAAERENKFLGDFYQAVRDIQDDEDLPKGYAYDKIEVARYDFEDRLAAALAAKGAK